MIPIIKTTEEIIAMREGGKILAEILYHLKNKTELGITTKELDELAKKLMDQYQVQASFKGYRGYPAYICTSVNEEVVHSIPGGRKLNKGDIIKIDCGVLHKKLHTDAAVTVLVPPVKKEVEDFVILVEKTLYKAIDLVRPGIKVGDISNLIQQNVEKFGYSPVRELTGHGVGRTLHEDPQIPNYGKKGSGYALKTGMTLAIEPIINMGQRFIETLSDKWTIATKDGSYSAQFEHTVAVTDMGAEILTKK